MKLGIIGDTHYTNKGPSKRRDDFFATQLAKTAEAFTIFQVQNCDYVLQVGDLFDSHTVANRVKAALISILKMEHRKLYCIAGQHDIVGHSLGTLPNSPLAVLEAAGSIQLVNDVPTSLEVVKGFEVEIYGASFGAKVPTPKNSKAFNILIIHAMIGDRLLYPGQNLASPEKFLKNHPDYDLVAAGDYHYSFQATYQNRTIVNPGCLVRKTVGTFDLEHKPSVVTFDTETKKVIFHPLTIEPAAEVFDLTKATIRDSFDTDKFIQSLKRRLGAEDQRDDQENEWTRALKRVMKERKSSKAVQELIDECMEKVKE